MSLAAAAALGLGLGAVTGMPLGVVNVAIVDAGIARRTRFALGLALGGALADTAHAALAFLGVGRLVLAHPTWVRALAVIAAVVIAAYALAAWRGRRLAPPPRDGAPVAGAGDGPPRGSPRGSLAQGAGAGLALTLPNPGALGGWATIAAAAWPAATTAEALVLAGGVGVGSAAWFALLGRWAARVRPDHPALRHLPRVALAALIGLAALGVARAFS